MSNTLTAQRLVVRLQLLSRWLAVVVTVAGVLIMLGWVFNVTVFKSLFTSLAALRFNIGLCFALSGVALYNTMRRPRLSQGLAVGVVVIALLTLSQHVFGWELGIDQLLMRDTTVSTNPAFRPGRMSPITSFLFALMGGAILLSSRKHYLSGQIITLIALFVSLVVLLGYSYDVQALYRLAQSTSIALHTAVVFSILGFGTLFAFPDKAISTVISADSAGGFVARRVLPAVVLIPLIIGWLEWRGEITELYSRGFGLAIFTLLNVVLFGALMVWISGRIHDSDMQVQQANAKLEEEVQHRKEAEESVRKLNTELEQRVQERTIHLTAIIKELDSFNYSVSHDLRSPLRAMDGYALALLEDQADVLDDTAKRYLTRIRTATQRMGIVIDDLLQLAQLSRKEMIPTPIDLRRLTCEILQELKEEAPDREVEISVAKPLAIVGDFQLIRVAMQNLLDNAWKFTRKQSHPKIEVGSIERAGRQTYFVRDNGVGFDMRFANKLFRAFQRLHDIQEFEGTGIGLAIVARIIQRHGGEIWAESEIDQGATFYFTI